MAVDYKMKATSRTKVVANETLAFSLTYSLPVDRFREPTGMGSLFGKRTEMDTEVDEIKAIFFVFDGSFMLAERYCIFDMAPFELVNEHQWRGQAPVTLRQNGNVYLEERPLWGISSFDASKGERILAGMSHAPKDSVFTVQYRLNVMLDYVRKLLTPYENEVRENHRAKLLKPEGTPESHPEQHEMLAELLATYRENPPNWQF